MCQATSPTPTPSMPCVRHPRHQQPVQLPSGPAAARPDQGPQRRGHRRQPPQCQSHDYGDFPAHQGLWTMCEKTAQDVTARMALVPRTLEARGLDATPQIQAKLRQVGTPDALSAVDILDIILREEVGHVAIGNLWYRFLCKRNNLEPQSHYTALAHKYEAPRPRPPFNTRARQAAGFTEEEIAWLEQQH